MGGALVPPFVIEKEKTVAKRSWHTGPYVMPSGNKVTIGEAPASAGRVRLTQAKVLPKKAGK